MTDFLQLSSLKPLSIEVVDGSYIVHAEGRMVPSACPECQTGRLHGHGTQKQYFRDTPTHGKTVQIAVQRRRYRCQDCHKTMFDPIPDLDTKRLATTRLIHYIRTHCFRETFASIARQVNMDEKTIRHIFDDYADELGSKFRFVTPRFMGIDELKIVGAFRAMITNVERRTVFDMRATRSKADLLAYFKVLPDRDSVEWVAMDMYHVYRQVMKEALPEARIVVDRFHIQRMANEVLEKMRKRFRKTLTQRQRLKLKDERFLLLKRKRDLSPEAISRISNWFQQFPLLGEAHSLKEAFFAIWENQTRTSAETAFQAWLDRLDPELRPDFKELTTAMTNWHGEVFAYFDNPITNAYTESVNNLAKGMNRMGRGYSFEVIRARMLYDEKARKDGSTLVSKRGPEADDDDSLCIGYATGHEVRTKAKRGPVSHHVIEYGPYIPTLTKLLESGHFE
ncbi:MAG TPA: ISL3 family transposase [Dokdonella sp.]|uniref:ISL3 family transposase n=1 Tax=Dokdonella sp. TaxID=2291710 RepID=UPI002D7FEC9A|nr:ISL3 family transposase [Dokdonella sp.]HET9033833.1 ISL3 family transposase [Dokdonella sp.]